MRILYSIFLVATFGLLVNNISSSRESLFSANEMREVNRRLKSIETLR